MNKVLLYILLFLNINIVFSCNNQNPIYFLENVLEEIKPSLIDKNDLYLKKIMDKYVDFEEIALWLVGKKIWVSTSIINKNRFMDELKILLLKTYKKTVYYYLDADIEFLKPKIDYNKLQSSNRVQIFSIIKKGDKNISISYRLIKKNDLWFVFDIIIEGISILKGLQTQYTEIIKKYGIEYAIDQFKIIN